MLAQRSFKQWLKQAMPLLPVDVLARQPQEATGAAAHAARAQGRHAPRSPQLALLTVTVEQADLPRVRASLDYSGLHSVEFVRVVPVAGCSRIRMDIALKLNDVEGAMSRILTVVNKGEFGRVTIQQANRARPR